MIYMNGKTLKALLCAFVLLAAAVLGSCSTGCAQSVAPLINFIGSDESLAAGDYVAFGHYEQDNDLSNGAEPIEWRVVSMQKEMGKVVLLSRYGLDARPYHNEELTAMHTDSSVSWDMCDLRIWLNDKFYNMAFSPEEQSAIIPLFVDSSSGSYCPEEYSGEYTDDLVSIFTIIQARAYRTGRILDLATTNTAYAEAQGAPSHQGNAEWWLCTHESYVTCHLFKYDDSIRSDFLTEIKGVRPIILVKPEVLTKISFQ